jgi:hypothetical protein
LQDVLGVSGAAGDALGGAKNASVMRLEECFELSRGLILHESQGFYSGLHGVLLRLHIW